mmetsp:Transcript_20340/g.36894  ORF Transcript_20340/g.36894 Transcript_20340/m.36894 type:complete len:90 (+) Transcript_20340:733-1002(+)
MSLLLDFILERLFEPSLALDLTLACVIKRLGLMLPLEKFGLPQLHEMSVRFHTCLLENSAHALPFTVRDYEDLFNNIVRSVFRTCLPAE